MPEIPVKEALNKAFVKVRPERAAIDKFKANLLTLIDGIKNNPSETEEFIKNLVSDFLKNTWYAPDYFINTHKSVDLVIHDGVSSSPVSVLIEAKKPGNKNEMVSQKNINVKALHELLLYYFRETIDEKNLNLKYLIITNAVEWFIFDASVFYRLFSENKNLVDLYSDFKSNSLLGKATDYFYTSIATPEIEKVKNEIEYTYFNITEYENVIRNNNKEEDNKLINLYKILSPNHLLKKSFINDSNTLNDNFYFELLYIMGLTERKEEGKKTIDRYEKGKRQSASLIEETIYQLLNEVTDDDELWDISLDLSITWINRIIFLKLLESQQLQYQNKNMDYSFLNTKTIKNFNDLNILFFNVLAVEQKNRVEKDKIKFINVPYLNSSLFEKTENEHEWLIISSLQNEDMDISPLTVLKDKTGNKRKGKIKLLDYLFEFLNAYDFSSEGTEKIQEEKKTLINASVLGLIFEKINGYKDGSYFTPGFVTSYICSETVKNIVINKFNEKKSWNVKNLIDIFNKINNSDDIAEANKIINSITIVDPAVGSGHFLVSALNELIAIKSKIGILVDNDGKKIRGEINVINDELIVDDEVGGYFEYKPNIKEKQRIQEALFQEKRRIIENCLFGVDINPNSVKICRLRLWIELLKNAYYTKESGYKELETLPNLDINIKAGNSLISRFDLDTNIANTASSLKYTIKEYKEAVQNYKNSNNKNDNKKLMEMIKNIKTDYSENITKQNSLYSVIQNLEKKLGSLGVENMEMDFISQKQIEEKNRKIAKIKDDIAVKKQELDDFLYGKIYDDAFEWRFEFPEVLDPDGNFIGFDAVIGNPPYLREGKISKYLFADYKNSPYYQGKMDLWYIFACIGINLLKEKGILSFIATNNWTTAAGAGILRNYLMEKTKINHLIDFGSFMVFDTASIQTMIMSFIKDKETDNYSIDYRKLGENAKITDVIDILDKNPNNKAVYFSPIIIRINLKNKFLTFNSNEIIFDKIAEKGIYLTEKEVANGIHPHFDFVNKKLADIHNLKVGEGIFGLSEEEKNKLRLSKNELKLIKPYYTTEQIHRYYSNPENKLWLIYTDSSFKNPNSMDNYPKLKKHLDRFSDVITSDNKPYGLHRAREERFFKGEKIIVQRKCVGQPFFSYSNFDCYVSATFYVIKTNRFNHKYLVGLLNSKLIAFWLRNKGKMQGDNYQIDKEPLLQIPILNATTEQQNLIISLVDKIISAKNKNPLADITNIEKEIDKLIYKIYGLTNEEIAIIEGNL